MADLKPQVYKDPRPAEDFERFHERARTKDPDWVYDAVRVITTLPSLSLYRLRAIGTENVPASGPVILAPNHFSNMDHFFAGVYIRRRIRFMAKSQLFGANAVLTYIFSHGGVFPIRRGHHDEEAFMTAHAILRRGGCLLIYAEGGRSRTGGLGKPRYGVGRLALESGVPVVPTVIHGSLGVRSWRKLRFPKVTVRYGEPLRFETFDDPTMEQSQRAAELIFDPVRRLYAELEAQGRDPAIRDERRRPPVTPEPRLVPRTELEAAAAGEPEPAVHS
jgi:1-acyl-sn-glycerol-3-phosphate acyltransferase